MKRKAFTLVELLFVMAIISILAGFAISKLNDSTRAAKITAMKNDIKLASISIFQEHTKLTGANLTGSCTDVPGNVFGYQVNAINGACKNASNTGININISKDKILYFSSRSTALQEKCQSIYIFDKDLLTLDGSKYQGYWISNCLNRGGVIQQITAIK